LDEIEASHAAVGGTARGRRFATLQINQSYAVMVSAQFQGYCRDLHDECVSHFVAMISPAILRTTVRQLLSQNRQLDRGNPNPGNLGSDFNRFGLPFWPSVQAKDRRARTWQTRLAMLTDWRNAIAHQDFDPHGLHGISTLTLQHVKEWRRACQGLARTFDRTMRDHLQAVSGNAPW